MTDRPDQPDSNDLGRELLEGDRVESALTRLFASLQPPYGAVQRLMAKLDADAFHESQLTLDDAGPYNFAAHATRMQADQPADQNTDQNDSTTDLLAAGLEEEEIDDESDEH